ncbi:hypothetical protein GWK47_036800 [Chionoecetes opilio]|uniref:Uncharacterized protein n=1 Tax=Chionoecetes opilio TaxID=41210 RepID=A0A8J4YNK1_CHIOP|nr:hypothetical protein GWK47_036800 [Chionoecetes opilio]
MPWMFALRITLNYSRWLSIHIPYMMNPHGQVPDVQAEIKSGSCGTQTSTSSLHGIDQCHEPTNAVVKGLVELLGLTGNPGASDAGWCRARTSRITAEFELAGDKMTWLCSRHWHLHHAETWSASIFMKDVIALIACFEEMGNPFLENTPRSTVHDTRTSWTTSLAEL